MPFNKYLNSSSTIQVGSKYHPSSSFNRIHVKRLRDNGRDNGFIHMKGQMKFRDNISSPSANLWHRHNNFITLGI